MLKKVFFAWYRPFKVFIYQKHQQTSNLECTPTIHNSWDGSSKPVTSNRIKWVLRMDRHVDIFYVFHGFSWIFILFIAFNWIDIQQKQSAFWARGILNNNPTKSVITSTAKVSFKVIFIYFYSKSINRTLGFKQHRLFIAKKKNQLGVYRHLQKYNLEIQSSLNICLLFWKVIYVFIWDSYVCFGVLNFQLFVKFFLVCSW